MFDRTPEPPIEPPIDEITADVVDRIERNLKPCPFCMGRPYIDHGVLGWVVACNCGSRGPQNDEFFEATAAWDTRPIVKRQPFRPSSPMVFK